MNALFIFLLVLTAIIIYNEFPIGTIEFFESGESGESCKKYKGIEVGPASGGRLYLKLIDNNGSERLTASPEDIIIGLRDFLKENPECEKAHN